MACTNCICCSNQFLSVGWPMFQEQRRGGALVGAVPEPVCILVYIYVYIYICMRMYGCIDR